MKSTTPDIERFNNLVEPEPNTGCWLWSGTTNGKGYGRFCVGSMTNGTRRRVYPHRFSYEHFVGQLSTGECVLHKCDVPSCVNPEHLFTGSNKDNSEDMSRKNRGRKSLVGLPYGVSVIKGKFMAQSYAYGRKVYLGYYETEAEAEGVAEDFRRNLHSLIGQQNA